MKNAGVWRFPAYSTCKKKKSARIWSFCLKWQEKKQQLNDRQNTKRVNHALQHPQSIWIQCQKFLNPSKSPTLYSSEFSVGKDIWVPVNSGFKSSFVLWFRIRCIWFQMNFWMYLSLLHLSHASQTSKKWLVAGLYQTSLFLCNCNTSFRLFHLKLVEGWQRSRLHKYSWKQVCWPWRMGHGSGGGISVLVV